MTVEANDRVKYGIREQLAVAASVARVAIEPIKSAVQWVGYHDRGAFGRYTRRNNPDLEIFFGHEVKVNKELELKPSSLVKEIAARIKESDGVPQHFLGRDLDEAWRVAKQNLQQRFNSGLIVTDYLTKCGDGYYVFIVDKEQGKIIPLLVNDELFDTSSAKLDLSQQPFELLSMEESEDSLFRSEFGFSKISEETAAKKVVDQLSSHDQKTELFRLSIIANEFFNKRHAFLEREGDFFTSLRHLGVHSLGELQTLGRELFSHGLSIDGSTGQVNLDPEMLRIWQEIRSLPSFTTTDADQFLIKEEAFQYAQEQVFFRLMMEVLSKQSELVIKFMNSAIYREYAMEFKDKHLASFGATETHVAQSILANYLTYLFEGKSNPNDSPSQRYMADKGDYFQAMKVFIEDNCRQLLPEGELAEGNDRVVWLKHLASKSGEEGVAKINECASNFKNSESRKKTITEASETLPKSKEQMAKNPVHRSIVAFFDQTGLIVSRGAETQIGVGQTLIANLGLKRAQGRFLYSWFPEKNTSGYIPIGMDRSLPLLPDREGSSNLGVEDVIKHIFNGGVDNSADNPVFSQEQKIFSHSRIILDFLKSDSRVPDRVKDFISTVDSPELIVKMLETMGDIGDNDPNIVNRFFSNSIKEFQLSTVYRYVFDFVRGVESNLMLLNAKKTKDPLSKLAIHFKMWAGDWENHDFSKFSQDEIDYAIRQTLVDANSRIIELNHEVEEVNKLKNSDPEYQQTWKTIQEKMEIIFGWDTSDMQFLRWSKYWNIWNTLGATWDCICFSRKTVFNPKAFKTS